MAIQSLIQQAYQAEYQRKHVEHVMTLVALAELVGQERLVAKAGVVNQRNPRNPVAKMRLAVALYVVLSSGKIPHEVAPVHMVELVVEEIPQVDIETGLPRRCFEQRLARLGVDIGSDRLQMVQIGHQLVLGSISLLGPTGAHLLRYGVYVGGIIAGPGLVAGHVAAFGVIAVYTGQNHVEVRHRAVIGPLYFLHILVGLRGIGLHHLCVCLLGAVECRTALVAKIAVEHAGARTTVLIDRDIELSRTFRIFHLVERFCKYRAFEKRTVAVLLAVEVRTECKNVVGSVLVHRGIGRGAYQQKRIRRITHEYHKYADNANRQHPHRQRTAETEQINRQTYQHECSHQRRVADKRHARQTHRGKHEQAHRSGRGTAVKCAYGKYEHSHEEYGIDKHAHIVAKAEAIDKQQLEPLGYLHESRHEAVENSAHYDARHSQRNQRAGSVDILPLTVIEYEAEGGYAEQVEQVHSYRNTYHIGYKHKIAVAVRLVGTVFPLEHQPEHQSRAE